MDIFMLILTLLGTIAAVVSAIVAVRSKNEAKVILNKIQDSQNRNVSNSGNISLKNNGTNTGVISGISSGDINNGKS